MGPGLGCLLLFHFFDFAFGLKVLDGFGDFPLFYVTADVIHRGRRASDV